MSDHAKAFISRFSGIARHQNRYEVFRDFVTMAAVTLHNAVSHNEELEKLYLDTVGRYDPEVVRNDFPALLGIVIEALETPHDFLGAVYMDMEIGNKYTGQFFTPYDVSKLMAKMTQPDYGKILSQKSFITLSEPASGSGGMVIAFAEEMRSAGYNYQSQLWVQCIDIDPTVAMMAYIQLSLLGIPGEVVVGDTLKMDFQRVMRTPMHYLKMFDTKFLLDEASENLAIEPELSEAEETDDIQPIQKQIVTGGKPIQMDLLL
ncbi:N-6 DNA methylase [Methylophaga nitratireducenticrescens]|uniref:N-6 DNA methylase n=1 Tax=Methylophaga nitratireducenticrescens TaxID=754476 RepID=UPI000CDC6294|nr:N-6 DNA methylase [Methylophaga nitratireducenticrescens]AUZ86182.1 hypothetical protein CDW43_16135 [Methylophaga nitratireducenticrescens]